MKDLRSLLSLLFGLAAFLGGILILIVAVEKTPWVLLPIGVALCAAVSYFLSEFSA